MISLIIGKKGSGKTKRLIDGVNAAAEASKGNVVCIEKGNKLIHEVDNQVRLVDTDVYGISGYDAYYGFLSGICASNYDVTDVYADATLKIIGDDMDNLTDFIAKVSALSEESNTRFVFTISCDETLLPDRIFQFAKKM
jgi:hypothetical protein